ncbi:hypothetical protein E3J38_05000 [candidate division TA06 bacterium]|uniref:DUF4345 domain-containing protein n=1 Tax=candidate division TA06 bacterium TaxID=2250710 RepID=A0A523XNF4_UNCT6|nr:MAG: hypothetical protein E3J38_05000 [candidate division TA06 bacterium]
MARVVLIIAAIIEFVFPGLPAFFGSEPVAELFNLEYIEGAVPYVHAFGAVKLCFGVMFFIGARNPKKSRLVVDMGILRFALGVAAQLLTFVMMGSLHIFWWIHMVVDIVLVVLLLISRKQITAQVA